jgi:hypothetical protein
MKSVFTILLILFCALSFAQNFEGSITYKMEMLNPNSALIPDSSFQEIIKQQFGERGYMIQTYYYKGKNYISELDAGMQSGFQCYNPKDKLLYSWQVNNDTAITVDSRKYMDEVIEIMSSNETETILNIPCKVLILKSKMGSMKVWYNSEHFKTDPKLYKGHKYGHWEAMLNEIKCLPIKVEQTGFMTHVVQTATEYKETVVAEDKFKLPKFKVVITNPVN